MALVNAFGDIALQETNSPLAFAKAEIETALGGTVTINRKSLHKFGKNQSVGTSAVDINWDGIEPVHSTTNSIDTASSSNAGDTTQTIRVEGMTISGGDMTFVAQNVSLNGQTKVTLTTPLCRVTRIANVASATATAGDVYVYEDGTITGGVPDDLATVGNIMAQEHQTTMFAGTSIASNNYFIMTSIHAGSGYDGNKDAYVDIALEIRDIASVYRTVNIITLSTNAGGRQFILNPYLIIDPNSDIDLTAISSLAGVSITAGFEGYFADID